MAVRRQTLQERQEASRDRHRTASDWLGIFGEATGNVLSDRESRVLGDMEPVPYIDWAGNDSGLDLIDPEAAIQHGYELEYGEHVTANVRAQWEAYGFPVNSERVA